jgi:hypothetical protein
MIERAARALFLEKGTSSAPRHIQKRMKQGQSVLKSNKLGIADIGGGGGGKVMVVVCVCMAQGRADTHTTTTQNERKRMAWMTVMMNGVARARSPGKKKARQRAREWGICILCVLAIGKRPHKKQMCEGKDKKTTHRVTLASARRGGAGENSEGREGNRIMPPPPRPLGAGAACAARRR